jgi:hypothetical protein
MGHNSSLSSDHFGKVYKNIHHSQKTVSGFELEPSQAIPTLFYHAVQSIESTDKEVGPPWPTTSVSLPLFGT